MYVRFRQQLVAMRRKINSTPISMFDPEDLYECVGMEKYLSLEVYKRIVRCRRVHLRSILAVQVDSDAKQLSIISELNSEWTVTRSHDTAVKYWVDLKN